MKARTQVTSSIAVRRVGHHRGDPPCTLVLSWHPEEGFLTAGGFRRSVAVVQELAERSRVLILDSRPSIYRGVDLGESGGLFEYSVPGLKWAASRDLRAARVVQWGTAFLQLVKMGIRVTRRYPCESIYVPNSELLPCALAGVVLKQHLGRRLVLCNQNVDGIFARRQVLALHNRADAITVVSRFLLSALRNDGVTVPIYVTGNGTPNVLNHHVDTFERQKHWDGIFIGRHTSEKGVLDLLDIWERVLELRPAAQIVLIGSCSPEMNRRIRARFANARSLARQIRLAGVVSERAKLSYLASARVLLAPSHVEGWGFAPREAVEAGVPVVCWDLPVYDESLPGSSDVARVQLGDIETFAQRVIGFIAEDGLEREAGLSRIHETSWHEVAGREWQAIRG